MAQNKSKITIVLSLLCILSSGIAIYYANLFKKLKAEVSVENKSVTTDKQNEIKLKIETLDSLLLENNYQKASLLLQEYKTIPVFINNKELLLRDKLVSDYISNQKKVYKETYFIPKAIHSSESTSLNINSKTTDSLRLELKKTTSKLIRLQKQLNLKASNEYLTFKTSKGTNLHYVGLVRNSKANGFGIALLESGSRYVGEWKNNLRHGHGNFFWDDGEHYDGMYVNDKRGGFGTYFWNNGDKYIGNWKDDKRNGEGKFYNKKGKLKASGLWENDKLIKEEK